MSERDTRIDKRGCLLAALCMWAVILVTYAVIDGYFDSNAEHEIRDLQRRVGQLESERR